MSPGTASEQPPPGATSCRPATSRRGEPVADPRGGPPWAVRIFDGDTSVRCIVAGAHRRRARSAPSTRRVRSTTPGAVASGSCADPADEPLQVALARFADTAGTGPRSVLFGVAARERRQRRRRRARRVAGRVTLDADRTFIVVSDGLTATGASTVAVTLSDGSTRSYQL